MFVLNFLLTGFEVRLSSKKATALPMDTEPLSKISSIFFYSVFKACYYLFIL